MTIRVVVLDDYQHAAESRADWSGALPEASVEFVAEHLVGDELVARLSEVEIVVAMRERTAFPRELLERLTSLRLLVTTGMRNFSIDIEAARELGILVCGTRSKPGTTAELAWAHILGLMKNLPAEDSRMRAGGWQETVSGDLRGEMLGIVGLGSLGSKMAAIGAAFGMEVVAWSPNLTAERAAQGGARLVDKRELFSESRVVTLHLVLSEATRHVVAEPELRAMRPDSILVNTARAGLIDESALRTALEGRWIAGFGVDVYDAEPLPADHWLRSSESTLLTPHLGYVTDQNYRVFFGDAVEDIRGYLDGKPSRVL